MYRIDELDGDPYFAIAPTHDIALAVYRECVLLEEGEGNIFGIQNGLVGLSNDQRRGLPALLEFGPISMVVWHDERGWSLVRTYRN